MNDRGVTPAVTLGAYITGSNRCKAAAQDAEA